MVFQSLVFLAEIRISPTKPHGKGSKRKQDELDEDEDDYDEEEEEEEGRPTWVEALTQEMSDDEAPEEDPDYEVGDQSRWLLQPSPSTTTHTCTETHTRVCFQPSTVETESEEYRSHNSTESDIEMKEKGLVVIEDVNTVRWRRLRGKASTIIQSCSFFYFNLFYFFCLHRSTRERRLWPS